MSETRITYGRAIKPCPKQLASLLEEIPLNGVSNFGIMSARLTQKLSDYLQLSEDKELVLCSSGHTALMAAYAVSNCNKLLMPGYTFHSTICAATLQGIETVISDVDWNSGCLELTQVEKTGSGYYDGIVTVCALSNIPELTSLQDFCKQKKKTLIIDGASSFGTPGIYNLGDYFCLSFHGTKTFPLGEGGAVICSRENAIKIRQYINFGFNSTRDPVRPGLNAKLSEYTAAIGLAIWDDVQLEIKHKRYLSSFFKGQLSEFARSSAIDQTIYQAFPLTLSSPARAEEVIEILNKHNVEAKHYYKVTNGLPISTLLYERSVCIPCHSGIGIMEAGMIVDCIK